MRAAVATDADGWVRAIYESETRRPVRPDEHPVSDADVDAIDLHETFRVQAGVLGVPYDDREAWRRFRQLGHSGAGSLRRCRTMAALRTAYPDAGAAVGGVPHGGLHREPIVIPEVEDLVIRPFGGDDLDVIAPAMIAGGLQPATCPPECGLCQPPEAHAWLQTAARLANEDSWQLCLEFQGRPLQHEIIVRDPTGMLATFSLTIHHSRERPSWFWRECERPVFAHLIGQGVRFLQSRTRADRPDWIASLRDNYGATVLGDWGTPGPGEPLTKRLEFPVTMSVFTGWPARKQVGYDVTTGAVRVWEAGAADLPAVRQLVKDTVPVGQRAVAARVLEEWWHLDRATLLLGAKDGQLRYARTLRPRRDTTASLAIVGALFDEPEQATVTAAIRGWCQQAGYTTVSSFVPERLVANAKMQAQLARAGSRIVRTKTDWAERFVEMEMEV